MADIHPTILYPSDLDLFIPTENKTYRISLAPTSEDGVMFNSATMELEPKFTAGGDSYSVISNIVAAELNIKMINNTTNQQISDKFAMQSGMTAVVRYFYKQLIPDISLDQQPVLEVTYSGVKHLGGKMSFSFNGNNPIETRFTYSKRILKQNAI